LSSGGYFVCLPALFLLFLFTLVGGEFSWIHYVFPQGFCQYPLKCLFSRVLLLIRLTQQAPTGSVEACLGRRSPKPCGSSRLSLRPRMLAVNIWPGADGQMGSFAHAAVTTTHIYSVRPNSGSVSVAGIRPR